MRILLATTIFLALAFGETKNPDAALKAARHDYMLVSTRAEALFQAADTIARSLEADGSSLHPATITLRLRIQHMLSEAQSDLDKGDAAEAEEALKKASELVSRFARRIGGE